MLDECRNLVSNYGFTKEDVDNMEIYEYERNLNMLREKFEKPRGNK